MFGAQSPEERECRRESEPLVPTDVSIWSSGLIPLTKLNIVYKNRFVKCFVKKNFCIVLFSVFLGNGTCCFVRISGIKSMLYQTKVYSGAQPRGREKMTHEDVWRAIERFATEHGMSCSGLAKCSGLDPTTFNKSKRWSKEGQPRWPSTNSISKILSSTGARIQDFTKFIDPPDTGRD